MAERGLNQCNLIGRLGKDAEQRFTQSGKSVSNFSIAIGSSFKNAQGEWQESTEWVNIVLWGSENLAPYLTKGTRIHVTGRIQTRKWQDKSGTDRYSTEVVADNLILLGGGEDQGGGPQRQAAPAPQQQRRQPPPARRQPPPARATEEDYGDQDYDKDDVPF